MVHPQRVGLLKPAPPAGAHAKGHRVINWDSDKKARGHGKGAITNDK